MFTQCSQCKKTFSISIKEVNAHPGGALYCPHCKDMLSMLQRFKSDVFTAPESQFRSHTWLWFIGCLFCLALFAVQLYWTEGEKISQNPQQRIWLEKACRRLPYKMQCKLPVYKNLDEFETVHSDFQEVDTHYEFQAAISNQADFPQAYPAIKLRLLDFNSQPFAERVFSPEEYLGRKPERLMAVSESIEIHLNIAQPAQKVGGYTFDLI